MRLLVFLLILGGAIAIPYFYLGGKAPSLSEDFGYKLESGIKVASRHKSHKLIARKRIQSSYAITRDGSLIAQYFPKQIVISERETSKVLLTFETASRPTGLHFSPQQKQLALVWYDKEKKTTQVQLYGISPLLEKPSAILKAKYSLKGKKTLLGFHRISDSFFAQGRHNHYYTFPPATGLRNIASMKDPEQKHMYLLSKDYELIFPRAMNDNHISENVNYLADSMWIDGGNKIRVNDVAEKKLVYKKRWEGPLAPLFFLRAFNDGSVLMSIVGKSNPTVQRWNLETGKVTPLIHPYQYTRFFDVKLLESAGLISALVRRPKDGINEQTLTVFEYKP